MRWVIEMKKVLFIVHDMKLGGVQKSLLSFFQCFAGSDYAEQYELHLLVLDPRGELLDQIPSSIRIVKTSRLMRWMSSRINKDLLKKHCSVRGLIGEMRWLLTKRLHMFPEQLSLSQRVWYNWHQIIPDHEDEYDAVVSYQDGETSYYAMDKVKAGKKILWLHIDYQEQGYDPAFDKRFYEDCNEIVTVSEKCRSSFLQVFPQFREKIHVLENISSSNNILSMGNAAEILEYDSGLAIKILSVGRLNRQKGFDIAIDAAKLLHEAEVDFLWLVVGEGLEREQLQQQIDTNEVSKYFKLIGVRENPYPYMKACDILVQPSRFEGKSIVLDEAKIFCKPIVATNYSTVKDSLEHGKSGWIVDMNPQALCEGILRVMRDEKLRNDLVCYLKAQPKGNIQELQRYIKVMLEP